VRVSQKGNTKKQFVARSRPAIRSGAIRLNIERFLRWLLVAWACFIVVFAAYALYFIFLA
jgi:hypothetical protein